MKVKENAFVISQEEIAPAIFDLRLAVSFARDCVPGQFVSLYMDDRGFLLPRPISICEIGKESIRLVYRIAGKGTLAFSQLKSHDKVEVMGPLGNGFPLEAADGKKVALVGGGIGIPPMVSLGQALKARQDESASGEESCAPTEITTVAGYRSETFLKEEMTACGRFLCATEDGSAGTKGTVIDAMKADALKADVMFACGPGPMLRALKTYAEERDIELYVSLEEKMACGIGACLGCVCQSQEVDSHSHVHNKRICKDGPVFNARDVVI